MFLIYGVRKVKADVAAMISLIFLPVSSIFFAALFIKEIPGLRTLVGGGFLLSAGIYLLLKKKLKRWYSYQNA